MAVTNNPASRVVICLIHRSLVNQYIRIRLWDIIPALFWGSSIQSADWNFLMHGLWVGTTRNHGWKASHCLDRLEDSLFLNKKIVFWNKSSNATDATMLLLTIFFERHFPCTRNLSTARINELICTFRCNVVEAPIEKFLSLRFQVSI